MDSASVEEENLDGLLRHSWRLPGARGGAEDEVLARPPTSATKPPRHSERLIAPACADEQYQIRKGGTASGYLAGAEMRSPERLPPSAGGPPCLRRPGYVPGSGRGAGSTQTATALEQADDLALRVDVDVLAARSRRQAGHRPHLARERVTKPAPAESRTSRIGTRKPVGRPLSADRGSASTGVLAMQIGRPPKPSASNWAIALAAARAQVDAVRAVDLGRDRLDLRRSGASSG